MLLRNGKERVLLNRYRVMRLLALFCLVVALLILYKTVPAYYQDGLSGTEWQRIAFLSVCVLTALNFYLYGAKRDVTAQSGKGRRLSGSTKEFFYENRLCARCGQKRVPVLVPNEKTAPLPVPPGATTGGAQTAYYCVRCGDVKPREDCTPTHLTSARVTPSQLAPFRGAMLAAKAYRLNRQFKKQSLQITLGLLLLLGVSVYFASKQWLLLLPMWLCGYLFAVSAYNTLNNALLCYWALSDGLVQRDVMGYRFYPWQSVFAILRLPPYETTRSVALYTQRENLVISPIIEEHMALIERITQYCPDASTELAPHRGKSR